VFTQHLLLFGQVEHLPTTRTLNLTADIPANRELHISLPADFLRDGPTSP